MSFVSIQVFAMKDETGDEGMVSTILELLDPINQMLKSVKFYLRTVVRWEIYLEKLELVIKNVGNRTMSNIPIDITKLLELTSKFTSSSNWLKY